MSDDFNSDAARARRMDVIRRHREMYLTSGGTQGHIFDLSEMGPGGLLPTLLLRTVGRKTGKIHFQPLIYGFYAGEWVIVASKGGAPVHPGWYHNMKAEGQTTFQVATQCFRASIREPQGEERARVWDYMARLFPSYNDYQANSQGREIPIVMMKPIEALPVLKAE